MILSYFTEGIERIFKIIDSNINYNILIGHKLDNYLDIEDMLTNERIQYNRNYFKTFLENLTIKYYKLNQSYQILTWAKTINNRKEVDFFQKKACLYASCINIYNLANEDTFKGKKVCKTDIEDLAIKLDELIKLDKIKTKSHIHQLRMYISAYLSFQYSFQNYGRNVSHVILANDHSPIPVALSMIAKSFNISRIYLQHAEVSEAFPALDFEYSILRNKISVDIYKKISKVDCEPIVMSRFINRFNIDILQKNLTYIQNNIFPVVIYLSGTYNSYNVEQLIQILEENKQVGQISIKLHPNGIKKGLEHLNVKMTVNNINECHLAIVGNSSVIIELLHKGIPVVQNFDLDSIKADYYGFVSNKIVNQVNLNGVKSDCLSKLNYNDDWLERYSQYNASSENESIYQLNLVRLQKLFFELNPQLRRKDCLYEGYLRTVPVTLLNSLGSLNDIHEFDLVKQIEVMFNNRDIQFNKILEKIEYIEKFSLTYVWLLLKKSDWTGYEIGKVKEKEIIDFLYNFKPTSPEKKLYCKVMESLLIYFIRLKNINKISSFWEDQDCVKKDKLHINRRIALGNLIKDSSNDLNVGFEVLNKDLSEFHKFKFQLLTMDKSEFIYKDFSYETIQKKFIQLAPSNIVKEYEELNKIFYSKIRTGDQFFDVRWNFKMRDQLFDIIKEKLIQKKPFGFIRLSDGEGYIFNEKNIFTAGDRANRERHWWGMEIESDIQKEIKRKNLLAIEHADLLGVPTIYRFLRDHTDKSHSLGQSLTGRGLLEVIWGVSKLTKQYFFTDDKANLALFTEKEKLLELAKVANRIVFVGSASPSLIKKIFHGVCFVTVVSTKTHFKTTDNIKYTSAQKPLPYSFEDILNQIERLVMPGDLVLVAAGVVGKMFVASAKTKGAVALDIGSALDQLIDAGIHSLY